MSQRLRYNYAAGDTFNTSQNISFLLEYGGADPVVDKADVDCTVKVTEKHDDGSATLHVKTHVTTQLAFMPPLAEENAHYRINERGELVSATPAPPALPYLIFPLGSVELKESWNTMENSGQKRVSMEHTLAALEDIGNDVLAHVVSEGTAPGDPAIDLFALRIFSIHKGHPLLQRTVVKNIWTNGRVLTVVMEEKPK